MARNTEGRGVVVHLDESELQRVLDGTIPTASGYRTLRAIGRQEVRNALTDAVAACCDAGAAEVAITTGRAELGGRVTWAPTPPWSTRRPVPSTSGSLWRLSWRPGRNCGSARCP